MLFNSWQFLIFFPVVTAVYFVLPHRFRWAWLLLASCYFYMAFIPVYILILFFTIVVDYVAGILIQESTGLRRRLWLIMSLIANVGVLAVFKYYNFFIGNLEAVGTAIGWNYDLTTLSWVLPIGLSFHTFQAMSYTIEVYRGNYPAERHFGIYALYVMFFPQLVAGPIERPQHLLPQFHAEQHFDTRRVAAGLRLMLWGFFKKVVIADNAAILADQVFNYSFQYHGLPLLVAALLFSIQLYADFSGYSDIARGSARVLGIGLMKNFNLPYLAQSLGDFWRRWHISLSSWFKDYLYIPLGGNRGSAWRHARNLLIVFLVSGLWHGANWTYVVWGGLHGAYLGLAALIMPLRQAIKRLGGKVFDSLPAAVARGAFTFLVVTVFFVFFRARTLAEASHILLQSLQPFFTGNYNTAFLWAALGTTPFRFLLLVVAVLVMIIVEYIERNREVGDSIAGRWVFLRYTVYNFLLLWIFFFGYFGEQPFIYFQF